MNIEYSINATDQETGEKLKCLIKLTPSDKFRRTFKRGETLEVTVGHYQPEYIAERVTEWYRKEEKIEIVKKDLEELLTTISKYAIASYINARLLIVHKKTYLPINKQKENK